MIKSRNEILLNSNDVPIRSTIQPKQSLYSEQLCCLVCLMWTARRPPVRPLSFRSADFQRTWATLYAMKVSWMDKLYNRVCLCKNQYYNNEIIGKSDTEWGMTVREHLRPLWEGGRVYTRATHVRTSENYSIIQQHKELRTTNSSNGTRWLR